LRNSQLINNWLLLFVLRCNINEFKLDFLLDNRLFNLALFKRENGLSWEYLRGINWHGFHKDVTPNLLSKAIVISMNESKERYVVSWSLRCLH
jgi:hypothetical protein